MKSERIKSIIRPPWRRGFLLIPLVLASLVLSPQARAVCQEGCDNDGNTFLGDDALLSTSNVFNTAVGAHALQFDTSGKSNTANGASALYSNISGNYNTAHGFAALFSNTIGFQNTATGAYALQNNVVGNRNIANGFSALLNNTTGNFNTAVGFQALFQNGTGSNNVALGFNAGSNLTRGNNNVCIGYNVVGVAGESDTTRIGNIFTSAASGRAVYVNSDNKIGTLVSSRRFKEEIKPMDKASEAILALKTGHLSL